MTATLHCDPGGGGSAVMSGDSLNETDLPLWCHSDIDLIFHWSAVKCVFKMRISHICVSQISLPFKLCPSLPCVEQRKEATRLVYLYVPPYSSYSSGATDSGSVPQQGSGRSRGIIVVRAPPCGKAVCVQALENWLGFDLILHKGS